MPLNPRLDVGPIDVDATLDQVDDEVTVGDRPEDDRPGVVPELGGEVVEGHRRWARKSAAFHHHDPSGFCL